MISAKVRTIKGLQSDLKTTKKELEELRKENRLLNRIQARQEKDLQKCVHIVDICILGTYIMA